MAFFSATVATRGAAGRAFTGAVFAADFLAISSALMAIWSTIFCCVAVHNKESCVACQQKMVQCSKRRQNGLIGQCQTFEALKMIICRTELTLNHGRTFEEMTDCQFLRDADTAMRLDRVLTDKFGSL